MNESSGRAPTGNVPPPASGAWVPGDPPGNRRFFHLPDGHPFSLEGGGALRDLTVAYETWGRLDARAGNAVLICHALTGDSHVAGRSGHGHPSPGWWDDLVGPGRAIDTDRYFVVCANVLGGCQGSTGPSSTDPTTGRPYGSSFPVVSIRDMVRAQALLADHLGVGRWLCVVGGSMGGMQVLEWAVVWPDRVRAVVPIATCLAATAQQIGFSYVQRSVIALDPGWRGGDYYDAAPGEGPHRGLAAARALAQITYRSDAVFNEKFGRAELDDLYPFRMWQRFEVEGYLDYHGAKLVRRFDANSYLTISKAMDLHDVGRGRSGIDAAVGRVHAPALVMSVNSDTLYRPDQQEAIRDAWRRHGLPCEYVVIDSPHGHDAFLLEPAQVGEPLAAFLADVEKSDV